MSSLLLYPLSSQRLHLAVTAAFIVAMMVTAIAAAVFVAGALGSHCHPSCRLTVVVVAVVATEAVSAATRCGGEVVVVRQGRAANCHACQVHVSCQYERALCSSSLT